MRKNLLAARRSPISFKLPRLHFEVRLIWLLLLLAAPTVLLGAIALYTWHVSMAIRLGVLAILIVVVSSIASAVFWHIVRPLQALSNVVSVLRENEYSLRARQIGEDDALGYLAVQINELADDLRTRRHRESEAFVLLERVVETMDLPVFAFDTASNLQLTNPAALKMLQMPATSILHRSANSLGLTEILHCPDNGVVALTMNGREGQWMVRRSKFYQNGMPHTLLLLSDVSGVLRKQERQAWQRLIRVLAHEVNNSLTPIKSIAGSLRRPGQTQDAGDVEHGLAIIEERAESLNRFLQAYTQLSSLPVPVKITSRAAPLLERVCHLETRLKVTLNISEETDINVDAAQLEQALINVIRNAVDAAMQAHNEDKIRAQVVVLCKRRPDSVVIKVVDNGMGLANPANLFVPFYTTKPGGTGIGLILALQIIEAHGGTLTLANRDDAPGCRAEICLPITSHAALLPSEP